MNKLAKRLIEVALALSLFSVIYFFTTYNYKDDKKLQSNGDGVYENVR